jgi:hypothetical protein
MGRQIVNIAKRKRFALPTITIIKGTIIATVKNVAYVFGKNIKNETIKKPNALPPNKIKSGSLILYRSTAAVIILIL